MGTPSATINIFGEELLPKPCRGRALFERACLAALGGRRTGELNLIFLRKGAMRRLNRRYLAHDRDTDVLAFGYAQGRLPRPRRALKAGRGAGGTADIPLGDVCVSIDQARKQSLELGHSLLHELLTLAVHGILHLLGYDDHAPKDRKRMFARQKRLVLQALRVLDAGRSGLARE